MMFEHVEWRRYSGWSNMRRTESGDSVIPNAYFGEQLDQLQSLFGSRCAAVGVQDFVV
jgi:hypothetical protein